MSKAIQKASSKSYESKQQTLFQFLLANTDDEKVLLSNTVDLWDCIPKYFITKTKQNTMRKDGMLPTVEKEFKFLNKFYSVKLRPARLTVDGKDKEFFPSEREFLVELALRKLALTPGSGFWEKGKAGVSFSLNRLREELKKYSHTYSIKEIKEALKILTGCFVEVESLDSTLFFKTPPLSNLVSVSRKDFQKDPKAQCYVEFSSFVTEAIEEGEYRQHNYSLVMKHRKNAIARYLNIRMSQVFKQAEAWKAYTVNLMGIERDSGLLGNKRMKDNAAKFERGLNVLKKDGVLDSWMVNKEVRGGRTKQQLINVFYDLYPTREFSSDIKRSNAQVKHIFKQINEPEKL